MSASVNAMSDVVIAGAGVAGLSAGVALARAGVRVVCIDPERPPRARVGESLDWSAPGLLAQLDLPRDEIVAAGVGTYKRQVRAVTPSGDLMVGRPRSWLHRWPLRFEHVTLHLDRHRFDELLYDKARSAGVAFVWDHVTDIRFEGDRIVGFGTRSGQWFAGDWFIDAAGRRRLIARRAGIDRHEWGVPRVSLWSHGDAPMRFEGTMLHLNGRSDDLTWAWEIPISAHRQSVGIVMALSRFRSLRKTGRSLMEVLVNELARFPQFPDVSPSRLETVRARTYRPFVSAQVTGVNWLMIGEAAAFADPITSIGVTMAMRHASEASQLIIDNAHSPAGATQELSTYDRRVRDVAGLYNLGVETLIYRPLVRRAFGIRWASRAYVPLGYLTNSLYTRLKPTTRRRMTALGLVVGVLRLWTQTWLAMARLTSRDK